MPSGTVRWYHGRDFSVKSAKWSFGVTEETKPTSSWSGLGVVNKVTAVSYTHLTLPTTPYV
mgnify:CR=1 FL=1